MTIKSEITVLDIIERFKEIDDRYAKLVKDIGYALAKLDETKIEMQKSREIYESGIRVSIIKAINKHSIISIFIAAIIFLVLALVIDWEIKTDNFKADNKNWKKTFLGN